MRLVAFLFALARVYLPIPSEFKVDMEETRRDAQTWYDRFKDKKEREKISPFILKIWDNVFESWPFRVLLMFLIVPIGLRLRNMMEPEKDEKMSLQELLEQLNNSK